MVRFRTHFSTGGCKADQFDRSIAILREVPEFGKHELESKWPQGENVPKHSVMGCQDRNAWHEGPTDHQRHAKERHHVATS